MSLRYAILVSLAEGPKTGYDVAKHFDENLGFFWRAQHSQIYRDLRNLQNKGYVSSTEVEQSGKPNRILCRITDSGRQQLKEWSATPSEPQPMKDDFLIQLYGIESIDLEALRENLHLRLERHKDRLVAYQAKYALLDSGKSLGELGQKLALQVGIRYEREWAEWCAEALTELNPKKIRDLKTVTPLRKVE